MEERRNQIFRLRVSASERERLETLARRLVRTPSDVLRVGMRSLERELDRQQQDTGRSSELLTTD